MLGPVAFIVSQVTGAVRRMATAYGLMAAGGLVLIFAAGYGLDAAHALLTRRYGPATASLIVAAGLVVLAILALAVAFVLKRRPQASVADRASYAFSAVAPGYAARRRMRMATALAGGAATAGLAVLAFLRRRSAKVTARRRWRAPLS